MFFLPGKFETRLRGLSLSPALLPWLPFTSRTFGPPRRHAGVVEYFSQFPGALTEVYPATRVSPPSPILLNEVSPAYFRDIRTHLPPAYVFSLPRARLLGSAGWIAGEKDTLLVEASFWREPDFPHPFRTHFILARKRALPLRRLHGRTLSLASDFAIGGFGHFLHDSLARLHLVERAGHRLRDFDWLYLPRLDTPTTRRLVAALDFPADRILQHDPRHDFEAEELVATTYPGAPGNIPAYTPAFLRTRFATGAAPPTRRVFLSRQGFRRDLVNREEIERLLLAHGFELCLAHETDAVRVCAEARVIIAQEGANFMNALFAPPGTKLLLLLPQATITLPYAITLAAAAGHELAVQSCPLADPAADHTSDVLVDAAVLAAGLSRILAVH